MKKIWLIVVTIVALLAIVGLAGCSSSSPASGVAGIFSSQQEGIWVSGTGKVSVTPDVVNLNLGVKSEEATVAAAQSKAVDAMNKVMAVLKTYNIEDKDIQTQQYSITPVYTYDDNTRKSNITGYQVSNIVNIKIRNTGKAGEIIDAVASAAGDLTVINNISFSVDDPTQYYTEAREKAMADATDRAEQLASLGKVTLGKPIYITESTSGTEPIYYAKAYAVDETAGSTSISTGETDIIINVQVTYSILK